MYRPSCFVDPQRNGPTKLESQSLEAEFEAYKLHISEGLMPHGDLTNVASRYKDCADPWMEELHDALHSREVSGLCPEHKAKLMLWIQRLCVFDHPCNLFGGTVRINLAIVGNHIGYSTLFHKVSLHQSCESGTTFMLTISACPHRPDMRVTLQCMQGPCVQIIDTPLCIWSNPKEYLVVLVNFIRQRHQDMQYRHGTPPTS